MPIASIEGGDLSKVWEIKTLGLVRDADARKLLEDVAKQVQPIMRKRKWKVQLLSEFCPNNPSLLGLNIDGGREIRLRLRRRPSDSQLLDYEETLGTMLHELTHIQCGPHDTAFYKLLDELKRECEELMIKGIKGTGQGFDTRGQRLGGFRHNPPPANLREVALVAAEKRARLAATMPSGARRLGGDRGIMNALSPLQAAAMAAERRLHDDIWCAAPITAGADGLDKAREREESSAPQSKDPKKTDDRATRENGGWTRNVRGTGLAGSNSTAEDGAAASRRTNNLTRKGNLVGKQSLSGNSGESSQIIADRISDVGVTSGRQDDSLWECQLCTLLNPGLAVVCEACASQRIHADQKNLRSWTCKFCTLQNDELLSTCGACDQWRFSYGAPTSSRSPYVGT